MTGKDTFEKILRDNGEYPTVVHGMSMYPMVRSEVDPVMIAPAPGRLKRYDVAVYAKEDKYIVHRVLKVLEDSYVIRGDNCTVLEIVPFGDVVGVVKGFWRFGRYHTVTGPGYIIYSRVWVHINPLVRLQHKTIRLLSALKRKVISAVRP